MESPDIGGSKDISSRHRLSEWIALRTRRFWLIVVFSTIVILLVGIILGIYLMARPHSVQTIPPGEHIKPPEQKDVASRDLTHSYLVDIDTAEDEPTRAANRAKVISHLNDAGIRHSISRVISSPIFNGFSISVNDQTAMKKLASRQDIRNIWSNHPRIRPRGNVTQLAQEIPTTPLLSGSFNGTGFPFYGPHLLTGVDQLHNEGLIGTGIKVGLIDTGVDYTHPALGGCFGPGCKVAGGFDFAGDNPNTIIPDGDPMDCDGHGTHVTGILAADARHANATQPFVGVAPGVTVFAYKAAVCNSSIFPDAVVAAMARAIDDKVDIVSMSIGEVDGWPEQMIAILANRLVDQGIFVSAAAGNEGPAGLFDANSPASGRNILAVANADNLVIPQFNALTSEGDQIGYIMPVPFNVSGPFPLFISANTEAELLADACDPLPDDTPDLSQSVVLVNRGTCTLGTKFNNLQAKNATMILLENNGANILALGQVTSSFVALVSPTDADILRSNPNVTVSFPQISSVSFIFDNSSGGFMDFFTSWGPDNELNMIPHVAAPGSNIFSTFPLSLGGYATLSGTSMSTPYMAGIAALYLSLNGPTAPLALRNRFVSTADPVDFNTGVATIEGLLAPVPQQGGGLVNAVRFMKATTVISPAFLELNVLRSEIQAEMKDTANFQPSHVVSIQNAGNQSVTYNFESVNAATAYTLSSVGSDIAPFPPTLDPASPISISLSATNATVPAGQSFNLTVTFALNETFNQSLIPVYSGFIVVDSSAPNDYGNLNIPFMGVAANLSTQDVLDTSSGFPSVTPLGIAPNGSISSSAIATFDMSNANDTPVLNYALRFPSGRLRVDLLPADPSTPVNSTFAGLGILGNIADQTFLPRNNGSPGEPADDTFSQVNWIGNLSDGSFAPDGQYRLAARLFRWLAEDFDDPANWNTFVSPIFSIENNNSSSNSSGT